MIARLQRRDRSGFTPDSLFAVRRRPRRPATRTRSIGDHTGKAARCQIRGARTPDSRPRIEETPMRSTADVDASDGTTKPTASVAGQGRDARALMKGNVD